MLNKGKDKPDNNNKNYDKSTFKGRINRKNRLMNMVTSAKSVIDCIDYSNKISILPKKTK